MVSKYMTTTHAVESANGYTQAHDVGNDIRVDLTTTKPSARGQGEATARLTYLIRLAYERGGALISGARVSADGYRVVEALRRRGYEVTTNPEASRDNSGKWYSGHPFESVFEIRPPSALK